MDLAALPYPMWAPLLFLIVAAAYSAVGIGGGSSYTALMAILGFNILAIPLVSLTLNLCVTTVSAFTFIRARHARPRLILPILAGSIPAAYVGGSLTLPPLLFEWTLLASLLLVAARIYLWRGATPELRVGARARVALAVGAGAVLGLVAGIVGIGGGVYLVPLILFLGLGTEREAAACGAVFVWLNSASGLTARLQQQSLDPLPYLPLVAAVIGGAALGSFWGAYRFAPRTLQRVLGVIILLAIFFLGKRLVAG